jgi:hypothetical protein
MINGQIKGVDMRRIISMLLICSVVMSLTGCDALQRKFTRKKKTEAKRPRFYQLKKYPKKPSPELYKQHYAYWSSWQGSLLQCLGQNHKKDARSMEEALGHLKDMQSLLIPSKAEEMQSHIEKMENAKDIIMRGPLSFADKDYVRSVIDREDRAIKRGFCYDKIKGCLVKSPHEESAPKLSMAPQKGSAG